VEKEETEYRGARRSLYTPGLNPGHTAYAHGSSGFSVPP
jgi:hypothetical protein